MYSYWFRVFARTRGEQWVNNLLCLHVLYLTPTRNGTLVTNADWFKSRLCNNLFILNNVCKQTGRTSCNFLLFYLVLEVIAIHNVECA